jgi:hypothetical protein
MMLGVTYGGYTGRDFYGATMATLEAGGGGGTWSGESGGGGGFELGLPNESVTRDYFEQEIMDFDMYYNVCKGRSTTIPWHADMDGAYWHANKQTNTQTFANTRDGSGSWAGTGGSTGVFTDVTSGLGQSNGKAVTLPAFAPAEVKACGYRGHWANEANTGGAVVLEGLSTGAAVLQDAVYVYNPCGWLMNY